MTTQFYPGTTITSVWLNDVDTTVTNVKTELTTITRFFVAGESDSTAMFNRATAASRRIYVPSGNYTVSSANLPSNTEIYGDGDTTIINMPDSAQYAFVNNSGSSSVSNNITNIRVHDLQLRANSDTAGFSEFKHLVAINGVTNVLFENVLFKGFRGDGLYVGSGNAGQERHNQNVTVRKCRFDGINNANRNGISFIDINGALVEDCVFSNCSASNMPGPIDMEPDANAFAIIANVTVRNNMYVNNGGNVGEVSVFVPAAVTAQPYNITIENNTSQGYTGTGSFVFYADGRNATATSTMNNVKIINNHVKNGNRPFFIASGRRHYIAENVFVDCARSAVLSFNDPSVNVVRDVGLIRNRFERVGSVDGSGLSIFSVNYAAIENNKFIDCGTGVAGSSNAIDCNTGTSSYLKFKENEFSAPTGKTLFAIQKEAGHTFNFATNTYMGNQDNGLSNAFTAEESDTIETWYNPVVTGSTTAGSGTYSTQIGRYNRIGKLVYFRIQLATNSGHTGSGIIQVSLPTTVASSGVFPVTLALEGVNLTAAPGAPIGRIDPAVVVSGVGAIRCYQTATLANAAAAVIPAGAFTVYAEGFYKMP